MRFGPTLVLHCRTLSWVIPDAELPVLKMTSKNALIRYLTENYTEGKVRVGKVMAGKVSKCRPVRR